MKEEMMGVASLVLGILAAMGVCVSFVPLLNVLNCFTLPVALFGAILGLVDLLRQRAASESKSVAIAGFVISLFVLVIGGVRFAISLATTGGIV
jgi:uncharacterized membrane protein